jgi:peptide/nickel transport system ATP-binding protein
MAPLLGIDALTVSYATQGGPLIALDHMSIGVEAGETLALVGESGSGKSTVALAVMGLLGPEASASGSIQLEGRDIARLDSAERQALRGRVVSIVFQDPFTSLNPSLMVGEQVAEPLVYHQGLSKQESLPRAIATLGEVGLPNPASIARAYPHQLSGGMQQRVLIATAIICNPKLLILDEPTTALDVTVEAQILDLLDDIRRVHNLGMLFITHNLGVVNRIASRVCVLYAGRVVEVGNKGDVLSNPVHPYTKGLLASLPPLSAEGVHLRCALPLCRGALQKRRAGPAADRRQSSGALLEMADGGTNVVAEGDRTRPERCTDGERASDGAGGNRRSHQVLPAE